MVDELRRAIENAVLTHCREPHHHEVVLRALSRPGFALHPEGSSRAGALAFDMYRVVHGFPTVAAATGAAAVELQMEASCMLDHLADQELDPQGCTTVAEELAVAITLLTCGATAACEAVSLAGRGARGLTSLVEFHSNGIAACGGQLLDVHLERRDPVTTDEALHMTELKAGSLGRLAAYFGASLATDDEEIARLAGEFGFNLFTYLQLIDDIRDAMPANGLRSDWEQRKKTLPIVFFRDSLAEKHTEGGAGIIMAQSQGSASSDLHAKFKISGAPIFCAIVAEAFLNRAKGCLAKLESRLRGVVENLEHLVSPVEITTEELLTTP